MAHCLLFTKPMEATQVSRDLLVGITGVNIAALAALLSLPREREKEREREREREGEGEGGREGPLASG